MDNLETLATLGTQYTLRKKIKTTTTKQKTTKTKKTIK
jgi:hypothetical protein